MQEREFLIREERGRDLEDLMYFTFNAFRSSSEGMLINCMRPFVTKRFSLLAEKGGQIIGQALFIDAFITKGEETLRSMAVGLVAVLPGFRQMGIARALMDDGLIKCDESGSPLLFAITEPSFFMNYGFEFAARHDLHYKWPRFDSQLVVKELQAGALSDIGGTVDFTPQLKEIPNIPTIGS